LYILNTYIAKLHFRKILNELSSDVPGVPKIEEEKSEEEGPAPNLAMAVPTSIYQTSTGQYSMYAEFPSSECQQLVFSVTFKPLGLWR
jgi:hypothetical protein